MALAVGQPAVALVAYFAGIGLAVLGSLRRREHLAVLGRPRVARALLALAVIAIYADRHLLVSAPQLVPDDVVALVAVVGILVLPDTPRRRAIVFGLAVAAYVLVAGTLVDALRYESDSVVAIDGGARILLAGGHPYADFDMERELARVGLDATYATALEDGTRLSTLNYPGLALIAPTPLIAAGLADIRPLFLAEVLVLFAVVVLSIAPGLRTLALAACVGNVVILDQFIVAGVDPLWMPLAAGAWLARRHAWSAVLLGLAIADRQQAWLVAPFLIIWAARENGPRDAALRTLIAAGVAIAVDLPFLLTSPAAFFGGIAAPIVLPLVAHGIGPAGLVFGSSIPRGAFFAISGALLGLSLWAYGSGRTRGRGAPLVLPLASLWVATRSLQSYFACIPLFSILEEPETE